MPNRIKSIFSFLWKLAFFVLAWGLLSYLVPRYFFKDDEIATLPPTASPTFAFTVALSVVPMQTQIPDQGTETPAVSFAAPAYPNPQAVSSPPASKPTPKKEIEVSVEDTPKGVIITVTGGVENYNYQLGPLGKGAYALGPNRKFLVYVTNNGVVYVHRFGEFGFQQIKDARRDQSLKAVNRKVDPRFELSFYDNDYEFILLIYEGRFGQTIPVRLPRPLTYY